MAPAARAAATAWTSNFMEISSNSLYCYDRLRGGDFSGRSGWRMRLGLRPGIPERQRPVEHRRSSFRIAAVRHEIPVPLELEAFLDLHVLERGLEVGLDDRLRLRIHVIQVRMRPSPG